MSNRQRHALVILAVVLISLTLLAAPARGDDWWGVHVGSDGFGLSFGSSDWDVWGASWWSPSWSIDYHLALSGYGEWVWVDGLGQCWQPWVTSNWRPFTYGRWVWTAYGWTWVAYEPWGYFPHHFGNWAMAPVGWVWVPGTSYHAANVVWVSNDAWIGWYPSPPPGWSHHHHGHHDGWGEGWDDARYATFVGWDDLGSDDLSERALGAEAVRARTPRAVLRDGTAAPTRHELGRRGVTIPEMSLERRTARVAGREVMLARPREAAAAVERNAGRTLERALAPQAVGSVTRHATTAQATTATRALPRDAAATGRNGSTPAEARDGAHRSRRGEAMRSSPSNPTPAAASAPNRAGTRSVESRSGVSPARSTESAAGTTLRSPSAASPTPSTSRSRSGGREDERRAVAPSAAQSDVRSEEDARRSETKPEKATAAARSSSHRRR